MAITIKFFDSVSAFGKYIDQISTETKNALGQHLSQIEEIRKRYENTRKRFEGLKKLAGNKADALKDTKKLDVAGFKVLVNPSAEYELTLMEEAINSLQERYDAFAKVKEQLLPSLTEENTKIGVVLNDGHPTGFMFYMPHD